MKTACAKCKHEFALERVQVEAPGKFIASCPKCGESFAVDIDDERFKVLRSGKVVSAYTEKQMARLVRGYAREDGCTHYILRDNEEGFIFQTCAPWIDWQDIEEYAAAENATLLRTIEPK